MEPNDEWDSGIPHVESVADEQDRVILRALSFYAMDLLKHQDLENLEVVQGLIHEYTHKG